MRGRTSERVDKAAKGDATQWGRGGNPDASQPSAEPGLACSGKNVAGAQQDPARDQYRGAGEGG